MKNIQRTKMAAVGFLAVATLGLSACSGSAEETTAGGTTATESEAEATEDTMAEETEDSTATETEGSMAADPAADLVGPGCADYAAAVPEGPGSVVGMSQDPVAVAASNNPLLKTLVAAVSGQLNPEVNLVDTLNGDEFTVFAPVDDAFAKIDAATLESLKTDTATLSSILTYHVVPGQLSPEMVVGQQTTVQGGMLEVTGEGDTLMVNDANVICGGVHTANATVYLVDSVLMPAM